MIRDSILRTVGSAPDLILDRRVGPRVDGMRKVGRFESFLRLPITHDLSRVRRSAGAQRCDEDIQLECSSSTSLLIAVRSVDFGQFTPWNESGRRIRGGQSSYGVRS